MNKIKLIIGIIAAVVLGGLLIFYRNAPVYKTGEELGGAPAGGAAVQPGAKPPTTKPVATSPTASKTYPVVFAIKDAAANLGNLQSIFMTVSNVSILVPGKGWVPVVNSQLTFDLLRLKEEGAPQFLGELNLPKGTYNQIRLVIDSVVVSQNNISKTAKLPSGEMKIVTNVVVEENRSSGVVLDFKADKSLHVTGNGEYIFAPVIHLTSSRGVQVQKLGKKVELVGGVGDFTGNVGMDENGDTHANASIDPNAKVEIAKGKLVIIPRDVNQDKLIITADAAIDKAIGAKYIDRVLSVMAQNRDGKTAWRVLGVQGSVILKIYVNAETGEIMALE